MNDDSITIGLDVHVKTITAAAITADGEIRELGTFANTPAEIAKRVGRWGAPKQLAVCYEAGPCGYTIARQLERLGVACAVVAPALIPRRAGDRIKTDRRDALQLARLLRSGLLTAVAVPSPEQEALRALSRARQRASHDQHRVRQQLLKYLMQQGCIEPPGCRWTQRWWRWADGVTLSQPAAQVVLDDQRETVRAAQDRVQRLTAAVAEAADSETVAEAIANLRRRHGIGLLTAVGVVAEAGDLIRFPTAPAFMAYSGIVPREHSSGSRQSRGSITKAGNSHLRFLLVEAAWHYTRKMRPVSPPTDPVGEIAQRARTRLHDHYWRLVSKGKPPQVAIVAIARELAGYIWAVGQVPTDA